MKRANLLAVVILLVSGCEAPPADQTAGDRIAPDDPTTEVVVTESGAIAYQAVCADCHEKGLHGAPKTGDTDDWAGRSWLWEAVLFEHAIEGYKSMPPKGGHLELTDDVVQKAADYMLRQVYPDPPPD
jgi:cytochrome c5